MKSIIKTIVLLIASLTANAEVSINIDRMNNNLEFTVSNIETHVHTKYYGVTVEKKENDKWKVIRRDADCPCKAKCKKAVTDLGINECKKHSWDKKDFSCKTSAQGLYRFKVFGAWNEEINKNDILGVSSEFKLH